ncbi:hypothetical protein I6A84_44120 [Frankia sp. CNm7]|uniref:Integrase n=1 Tax=Frankia nepalensis TaxID=1836974 RepID=A0A937RIT8_9ACTN|nr:hypothetical protein [Frankia nepalensis]MBL7496725.1 hypothetical protein [Frankia nepalensis]MBL7510454.1 hypothetical protein [Frankia nepalensis]MBL7524846.1 hypothetical protein [Frankia nepalensis]MBL7630952.1 hypothetical protein [Frankia nepalensis]
MPVNVVQVALGHTHARTTLDRYTLRPADCEERLRSAFTDPEEDSETLADDPLTGDDQ